LNSPKTEADGGGSGIPHWATKAEDHEAADSQPSPPGLETSAEEAQQALRERPSVSIRRQLSVGFLLWLLLTLALAVASIVMISRIIAKLAFMEAATNYTFEVQQARRFEKNYFLYGTNLADAQQHVQNARAILEEEGPNILAVVGQADFDKMAGHLEQYEGLISRLLEMDRSQPAGRDASQLTEIEAELRKHGAEMVAVAEDLVLQERKSVSSMLAMSQRVPVAFLGILVLLMIYLASFISKHVISPLNRMMAATRRIAQGDFRPIVARRKYHDEFFDLAMAMNHMMHQVVYRQELLMRTHKLKAVGTLTAGVAHELNNPINNIILTASVLQEDFKDLSEEKCLELVNDLVGESERAQKIVRNLLDFARESEVELEPHKVQDIVEETLRLASNQIRLSKVRVEGEVEEHLPPVYGDRQQLEQVFLNLVLNALDAMPGGGVLRIKLSHTEDREFVAVEFEDTGVGIPKQHLREIFDPFFTSKKAAKGTGLGLSVSLGIVQRHGGDIRVESEVGKGTVFTVLLPMAKVPADIGNSLGPTSE
jgi:two-component system NtrC family sensor kinase